MTSKPWFRLIILVFVFIGLAALLRVGGQGFEKMDGPRAPKNSVLHLELEGVIMNGKRFLDSLDKYGEDDNVKAIVVEINSPGGAVGPSQEINGAIQKIREDRKVPVVCFSSGLLASGAYYSAVACDKIIVSPGALVGSIGVIMEFANLERLYDWAKVSRYSIKSGKFKDSGAEYRAMREDERGLFQDLINEVYAQFKDAVAKGRPNLKEDVLTEHADGRVFTGKKAVDLGFADTVGSFEDAVNAAADAAGLKKDDYELFKAPKPRRTLWNLGGEDEDSLNGLAHLAGMDSVGALTAAAKKALRADMLNRPMYIMPGTWE